MVRLYVGGLDAGVTPELLSSRFVPFGKVESCDVIPAKESSVNAPAAGGCRGFAYVQLDPKDDAALHKCLSLYNGCRWRGGVLRVEKARQDFKQRLQQEWDADAEQEAQLSASRPESTASALPDAPPLSDKTVRILRPDGRKMVAVTFKPPPGSRTLFPPFKQIPLERITWESEA